MKAARRLFAMINTMPKSIAVFLCLIEGSDCYADYTDSTLVSQQSMCHVDLFFTDSSGLLRAA